MAGSFDGNRRRLALLAANGIAVVVLGWLLWTGDPPLKAADAAEAPAEALARSAADALDRDLTAPVRTGSEPSVGAPLVTAPAAPPTLVRRVETRIANAVRDAARRTSGRVNAQSTSVAVCVVDVETGDELVAIQADRPLRPASNLKLLTTTAALVLLGPQAMFETSFERRGILEHGVLDGDLIARAGADPLFHQEGEGGVERWLDSLASQLSHAGVRRVRGRLLLDEGTFDAPAPGPAWPSSREYWKEYCALAGGFSANGGCLTARVAATREGAAARVDVSPRHHGLRRRGDVSTAAADAPLRVAVGASATSVTVRGSIPSSVKEWSARFAAPDPVELFGHAVVGGLRERGIEIEGGHVRERGVSAGTGVATVHSAIADTVVPILTHSNNGVADQLFLLLGSRITGQGTRAGGAEAVGRALDALGLARGGWVQVGGSGLSRDNRVSARQLCGLLRAVRGATGQRAAAAQLLELAMPVAGETGTLAKRMRDSVARGRVHAKTGFINGTSGLSGWLVTQSGRELVFSILVAYPTADGLNTACWKPMQDAICEGLVDDVE